MAFCPKYSGVRGIPTLGKFLIWLAVFLFFYSSFLVLFQFGPKNYAPKMIEGWGSIAQEFEKSYQKLSVSATAAASSDETAAPGQAQTGAADSGGVKKAGEIPSHVSMVIWGAVVICLLGFFWMIAVAFQESMLWGLGVLFVPGIFLIYWLTHFREATPPLILVLIGVFVQFFIFSYYGIDFQGYFLGSPPPPAAPHPDPLAGMIAPLLLFLVS